MNIAKLTNDPSEARREVYQTAQECFHRRLIPDGTTGEALRYHRSI